MKIPCAVLLGTLAASAGCSLLTDTSQKQCSRHEDCHRLFGADILYQCVADFCTRPSCSTDAQCRALGLGNGLCGADQHCKAGCTNNADCGDNMTCSTAKGTCEARQCDSRDDCPGADAHKACNNGMCEDTMWGCLGEGDSRKGSQSKATLKVMIHNANPRVPVPGLKLSACRLAEYDPQCAKPLEGVSTSYDETTGWAMIRDLPQDALFRLKIDPPAVSGLVPTDFYTQRPVRDLSEERLIVLVSDSVARTLAGSFVPPANIDPDEAALYLTVHDCENLGAMGVTLEVDKNDLTPGTQIGYLGDTGTVSPTLTATGSTGQGSILNLPANKMVALTTKLHGEVLSSYSVMPLAGRNTTVRFYPRRYAK